MPRPLRSYDRISGTYELSSRLFSGGKIPASKAAQLPHLKPGDDVLYLGVGAGEDAAAAAALGANVACVDLSRGMLDKLERRLKKAGRSAELICDDAFALDRPERYDAVAANYFLNVFERDGMRKMLRHAISLVKPGGLLMIADVSPPRGNPASRAFNTVYSSTAMLAFWALRLVPWHENYDYATFCREEGLEIVEETPFRFAGVGPVVFHTLVARKPNARTPIAPEPAS